MLACEDFTIKPGRWNLYGDMGISHLILENVLSCLHYCLILLSISFLSVILFNISMLGSMCLVLDSGLLDLLSASRLRQNQKHR